MLKHKLRPRVIAAGQLPKPNNFFYRLVTSQRFLAIIGLAFLLVIIIPLAKTYSQRRLVEQEIEDIKKEISDFETQNQELREMAIYLQTDQSLEEQARLNLNLKKPGEEVIVVEEKATTTAAAQVIETDRRSNYRKWWNYFFD